MNMLKKKYNLFCFEYILIKIEKILSNYNSKDKDYLVSEKNHLKDQCQNVVKILRKFEISTEENDEELQNYFEKIKLGVLDLLLLLKWNNFGALKLKIRELEKIKILSE